MKDRYRIAVVTAVLALFAVAMGFAASGVAAQGSATVSSEDVSLANAGDTGNSAIVINATEPVGGADIFVSVDTSVGEITGAQETQSGSNVDYDGGIDVAPDGSNATINYTDIQGTQSPFDVAELELQSNTGNVDSTPIALSDVRVINTTGADLSVREDEGTLSTGAQANFDVRDLDIDPGAVERGETVDVSAVVNNTGDASGEQDIVLDIEGETSPFDTDQNVQLNVSENQTVEFNNIDTSNFDIGDLNVTVSSDDDSETGVLTVFGARNFVDGDIGDTQLRPIANGGDTNITIEYIGGSGNARATDLLLVENVSASEFNNIQSIINDPNDNRVDSSVGNAGFIDDGGPQNRDEYFINLPNFGSGTQFQVTATLEGFDAFDGPSSPPVGPGEQASRDIRLERLVDADEKTEVGINDQEFAPGQAPDTVTVDLEDEVNVTTLVRTEDTEEGGGLGQLAPLAETNVNATAINVDDPNGVLGTGDVVVDPTSQDTNDNGEASFDVSLDLANVDNPEDLTGEICVTVEFDATEDGGNNVDDTVNELEICFETQPPSGDGTISGTVDEIDEDIPVGVQSNIEPAKDVSVHVFRASRAEGNSKGGNFGSGFDFFNPTFDRGEPTTQTIGAGERRLIRVVDSSGNELDVESDYLFTTPNGFSQGVALTQNLTIPGTGFDAEDTDGFGGDFFVTVLEPGTYTIEAYDPSTPTNFGVPDESTTFTAQNDLTYDAVKQRFANVQAVPTDVTNSQADFEHLNLFTDGENGVKYFAVAAEDNASLGYANARGYDLFEVKQNADVDPDAEQYEVDLSVQEADVQPNEINITNIGQIPNASVADSSFRNSLFDEQNGTNDIVRDGSEVDVIRVETEVDDSPIGAQATVEYQAPPGFNGQFLGTVAEGNVVSQSNDEITVDTSPTTEGQAFVFLETDGPAPGTISVNLLAELENGLDDDGIDKQFIGVNNFDSGSISGTVRNSNQGLPETVVWTREFEAIDQNNPGNPDFVFEITPVGGTQAIADAATGPNPTPDIGDEGVRDLDFEVTFDDRSNGIGVDESFTADAEELENIDLESRITGFNSPNVANYTLLRFPSNNPADLGDYSMDRVPARTDPPGGVDYTRIQAVQYSTAETGNGTSANPVRTGFTEDGDVVIVGAQPIESNFEVSNLNAPATATVGQQFDVNATVENTGGTDDTQDVTLSVNGSEEETETDVQLDPGENTTVEFTISVSSTGDADVEVASDDDSESTTVAIQGQADYQLSDLDPEEATVTEGDGPIDISADVDNVGNVQGDQDLELTVENSSGVQYSDTISGVQLAAGANTTETFTGVPAGALSPGEYDHIVSSDDDTIEGNLTVQEAPQFLLSNPDAVPDPVTQGDNVTISADVENVGGPGTQDIQFNVNGTAATSGKLDVAFLIDRSGSMSDDIADVRDATQDFAATIEQDADAQFGIVTYANGFAEDDVVVQQDLTDNVTKTENTLSRIANDTPGSTELNYDAINQTINNDSVLSPRSDSRLVLIDLTDEDTDVRRTSFPNGDILTPNGTVLKNEMESQDVSFFGVTSTPPSDLSGGLNLNEPSFEFAGYKKWLAENTSDGQFFDLDAQDLSSQFENEIAEAVASEAGGTPLTLNASETDTVEFEVDTSDFAPGEFDFNVTSPDDEVSSDFTVEAAPAPDFQLSNLDPEEATVTEGDDPINISADVDNVGGAQGTQDLELTVENSSGTVFSDTVAGVQLGAGANTTVEFTNVPAGTLSPGEYDHIVSSDNDTVEGNLTVESGALFEDPLPAFPNGAAPTNTQEIDNTLFEDVNGDGDGLDTAEAVQLWSDLIQNPNDYNSLTQAQVDALDWNGDGSLTPADAVNLWSEKIQAQP